MHASLTLLILLSLVYLSDLCRNDKEYLEPFLNKKYLLFYSEDNNYNTILKAIGVSAIQRDIAIFSKPVLELIKNGNEYVLSVTSSNVRDVEEFSLPDKWKTRITWDGRTVSTTFCSDQNTLWQWENGADDVTIAWSFSPQEVRCNMFLNGGSQFTCLRVYRAMN